MTKTNKYYGFKNPGIKTNDHKKIWLIIPFIVLTLVLVIIPLIMVFVYAFIPVSGAELSDNWNFINAGIWEKLFLSLFLAIATTVICTLLAYPFCIFLSDCKSELFKSLVIFIATAPIWTSFLVKLVGLKTFFDTVNGFQNSTFGNVYTLIGLVYLYLPFMLMPLYTALVNMPQNIVNASYDLGRGKLSTFINVVFPYTRGALFAGMSLVFLPSLTTVAVPQFLNNNADNSLIGDTIVDFGGRAAGSGIDLARASTLSLVVLLLIGAGYMLTVLINKAIKFFVARSKE